MFTDIVLIQGPLVGAAGMLPLADHLRTGALHVHVPDVLAAQTRPPAWSTWSSHFLELLTLNGRMPILVGYSASTVLAAELATKLPVLGVIFLDGDIPPASGPVAPGSERLRRRVDDLAGSDGRLPFWSDWWTEEERQGIGIADLARDPSAMEQFRRDQPRMMHAWFNDAVDLAPWAHVPASYIQLSGFFDRSASDAEGRGWPVKRLQGTHLHPILAPDETAEAIVEVARRLVA